MTTTVYRWVVIHNLNLVICIENILNLSSLSCWCWFRHSLQVGWVSKFKPCIMFWKYSESVILVILISLAPRYSSQIDYTLGLFFLVFSILRALASAELLKYQKSYNPYQICLINVLFFLSVTPWCNSTQFLFCFFFLQYFHCKGILSTFRLQLRSFSWDNRRHRHLAFNNCYLVYWISF